MANEAPVDHNLDHNLDQHFSSTTPPPVHLYPNHHFRSIWTEAIVNNAHAISHHHPC